MYREMKTYIDSYGNAIFVFLQNLNVPCSPGICLFKTEKCTNSFRTICDNHCNHQHHSFKYIVNKSFGVNALEFWDRRFILASTPLEFNPATDLDSSLANYNINIIESFPWNIRHLKKKKVGSLVLNHHLFIYLLAPIFWPWDSKPKSCDLRITHTHTHTTILQNFPVEKSWTTSQTQTRNVWYIYLYMHHKNWPLMWVNTPYPPQSLT